MAGTSRLKEEGFLLPREQRGQLDTGSSTDPRLAFGVGGGMVACCVLMVVGRGGAATWIGAAGFAVLLGVFAFAASRGVDRRAREVEEIGGGGSP